jgi:uncharacterized membrane protein YkoI
MLEMNITKKILISLSLLFLLNLPAQAFEKKVKIKDLPQAVQKTVQEQSKGASVRGLAEETDDGKTFYELELRVKGHTKDVLIDADGFVVEIEEEVALATLPPAVKTAFQTYAGKGKIRLVESIMKNDTIIAYEAQIKTGRKHSEIKVDADGQLISTESDEDEAKEKAAKQKKP